MNLRSMPLHCSSCCDDVFDDRDDDNDDRGDAVSTMGNDRDDVIGDRDDDDVIGNRNDVINIKLLSVTIDQPMYFQVDNP